VYFDAPILPFGSMAERALIDPAFTHPVPDVVPDGVAVALGIAGLAAWLALQWRAELARGEHVLVLGASGVVGQIAVQMARRAGAGRVVAAARSQAGLKRMTWQLRSPRRPADASTSLWIRSLVNRSPPRCRPLASPRASCTSVPRRLRRPRSPRRR
jgi:hypothetical protein